MINLRTLLPAILVLWVPGFLAGATISLNFEGFPDSTNLTTQYAGVTFSNAQILSSGISLNEFEFPPHSGTNVASDNGGPISILFATPASSFSGDFTYTVPLTLKAFSSTGTQVASATSVFSINLACLAGPPCSGKPGSSPNEFLQVSSPSGISRVTITGDPAGGSFVLDDAMITTGISSIPEPKSSLLLLSGLLLLLGLQRLRTAHCVRAGGRVPLIIGSLLAILVVASLPLSAAPTLGATFVAPRTVSLNTPTPITVSVSIPDSTVISGGINLVRINGAGAPTSLGQFHDDGMNGDAVAGDRIYSIQVILNEPVLGQIQLQVSAAFRGSLLRVQSSVPSIFVQLPNVPDLAIGALSSQLSTANVAGAVQSFSDTAKASAVLTSLNASSLRELSAAFNGAHLVRSSNDLRIYTAPWTVNGQPMNLEFTLAPDSTGKWLIVSW